MLASNGHRATFVATGILQGLVILVVAQFLRHPAAEAASAKPTAGPAAQQLGKRQFTTLEMLRTPQFYAMYIAFVLMSTGGLW
jgi:OFA family oxalate/formate antiporter-like MFS transporter